MQKNILVFLFLILSANVAIAQALQHKPNQLFLSPEISFGTPFILNQNNYGYHELSTSLTPGWQFGAIVGLDFFLKQSYKTGIIVSKWGQHYSDEIDGKKVSKKVNLYYLQIPVSYKHVFGRKRGYDHEVFSPYVFGSVRIGYPFYAQVDYFRENESGTLTEEDLVSFVTEGDLNINEDEIELLGNPTKDRHLFSWLDINLEAGGGYQYFVTRTISLFAEVHVVAGILDNNAGEWRFRNDQEKYAGSYNLYPGLKIGANFYLYKDNRG